MNPHPPAPRRGFCGIGIWSAKVPDNTGSLFRSAHLLGADWVFTVGARFHRHPSDTCKSARHVPYWRFTTLEDFADHIPFDCQLVCVENIPSASPLETFSHPERAVYLLGAEDVGIPEQVLNRAVHVVAFSSERCLNVACAGSIVLYDRNLKRGRP